MAPSTPPPPSSPELAALTIASTSTVVMSPCTISMVVISPLSPRADGDPHDQTGDQRPERRSDPEDGDARGGDEERDDGTFPFPDVFLFRGTAPTESAEEREAGDRLHHPFGGRG